MMLCIAVNYQKFKEHQTINPEDFFTAKDIWEYHEHRIHSSYCYIFLERANENEKKKVFYAEEKIKKAQSIKELLFAFAQEDLYLDSAIMFPFTIYLLLTDKTFTVQLKKISSEQEILNDDR